MLGVLGGSLCPPRAGWAQGNEEQLLDHGKAEPAALQHEEITPQHKPVHDEHGHSDVGNGSV